MTTVTPLDAAERTQELAQMLGGVSPATLEQARELRARAETWKSDRRAAPPTAPPRTRMHAPAPARSRRRPRRRGRGPGYVSWTACPVFADS